ncbi:MAG TPA: protein translocase subunit SecF [Streptosporangiaceae bacterium]|jgi:preprotein translocase subunit SecF
MSALGNIGGRLYRGEISVDFVGRRKVFYMVSGAILVISVAALLIRGLSFSVDFKGGSIFQFSGHGVTATKLASTVEHAGGGSSPTIQVVSPPGKAPLWQVQTDQLNFGQGSKVQNSIAKAFGVRDSQVSRQFVGPTWGSQISGKALEALIAFLIVIVIYLSLAFEWKMASAALVALLHDIVITIGVYALTGFQVSPATVIGLLTILGYSLYDTVVVFDKVRENTAGLTGTRKSNYSQAANLALNQTLVRSINTSLIALLPVAAILVVGVALLGNGELKDLSLVLFVGMLSGTYSSICIATPVLADLKEREPQYKQLAKQVALRAAGGRAKARKAAKTTAGGGGAALAGGGVDDSTDVADDELAQDAPDSEDTATGGSPDEPVPAASQANGTSAARGARPPASRQQPRRTSAAKRRPAGKKKRR